MLQAAIVIGIVVVAFAGVIASGNWPKEIGESSMVGLVATAVSIIAGIVAMYLMNRVQAPPTSDNH
ncbi:MAG: hypothetical protein HY329_24635 [Chloroflexi bacterium]|nr:hypothetical protein [Chloroflexota bacterium]